MDESFATSTQEVNRQIDGVGRQALVVLVSFDLLGDGILYLMMADNLRRNGFSMTLVGNIAHGLRDWVPQLRTLPYPDADDFEQSLEQYDLALVCPPSFIRDGMSEETLEILKQTAVLLCQKAPANWETEHESRLRKRYAPEIFEQFRQLSRISPTIRYKKFSDESVVEVMLAYMREKMGLYQVSAHVSINPPEELAYRRYLKRILVSPDSAWLEKKDWSAQGFMRVCDMLEHKGFQPVAPHNHHQWLQRSCGRLEVPKFDSIAELAGYIYELGALIANDSGSAHLASFLNIPVVAIYRKSNPNYWRPGRVFCPKMVLPGSNGRRIWRPYIRPATVFVQAKSETET
ncbi:MAG: hypothetical protein Kow0083_02180 [Methylophaga sp.]